MKTEEFPIDLFNLNLDDVLQDSNCRIESNVGNCVTQLGQSQPVVSLSEDSMMVLDRFFTETNILNNQDSAFEPMFVDTPLQTCTSTKIHSNPGCPVNIDSDGSSPRKVPSPYQSYVSPASSKPNSPGSSVRRPSPGTSPKPSSTSRRDSLTQKIPRHKRESHINAEHRRRCKIQNGFGDLKTLIPTITDGTVGGVKESKAGMLTKTVDYCRHMRSENRQLKRQAEEIKQEIQSLTAEINTYQTQLPDSGVQLAEVNTTSTSINKMFDDYLRARIFQNWKFWIFSMIVRPLFASFNAMVSTTSLESFSSTVMTWVERHCSLLFFRPVLINTLRYLSKNTSVMTDPKQLPDEALKAALDSSKSPGIIENADIDSKQTYKS